MSLDNTYLNQHITSFVYSVPRRAEIEHFLWNNGRETLLPSLDTVSTFSEIIGLEIKKPGEDKEQATFILLRTDRTLQEQYSFRIRMKYGSSSVVNKEVHSLSIKLFDTTDNYKEIGQFGLNEFEVMAGQFDFARELRLDLPNFDLSLTRLSFYRLVVHNEETFDGDGNIHEECVRKHIPFTITKGIKECGIIGFTMHKHTTSPSG